MSIDPAILSLLEQAHRDFDRARFERGAVDAQLVHKASNAEAEGVKGFPHIGFGAVALVGAGNRDPLQRFDANGHPLFVDEPLLDVNGKPITNSAGQGFDFVMPAFRSVEFHGQIPDYAVFNGLAERAGQIILKFREYAIFTNLAGWRYSGPADIWWAFVFELAWSKKHPLLVADKSIWLPSDNPHTFIPYEIEQLRMMEKLGFGLGPTIPKNWIKRLPDAFVSKIKNIGTASFDASSYLLDHLKSSSNGASTPAIALSTPLELKSKATSRRFAVALSFPGEHRKVVEPVAEALAEALGKPRVFYDRYYEAELSRPNLDLVLQQFYRDDADLIVVFVAGEYAAKEWCGIEWRAIREVLKSGNRLDSDIMFLRLDMKPLPGLLTLDGYLDIANKAAQQIANNILQRWTMAR